MMNKVNLFSICTLLLVLASCTPPRVITRIDKTYPALSENTLVEVIYNPDYIPEENNYLGEVTFADSGTTPSNQCDSISAVERLKFEARKAGGNLVVVVEYVRPSIFGSSCHQMRGNIFRINEEDLDEIASSDNQEIYAFSPPERKMPRVEINGAFGYGWRTAELHPDLSGISREVTENLMSGLNWDASIKYFINDSWGLGLVYSSYNASSSINAYNIQNNRSGYLDSKDNITFIGPIWTVRAPLGDKWKANVDIGLGYIRYNAKSDFLENYTEIYGASVGFTSAIGLEYKLNNYLGITANLSTVSGVLSSVTLNENGRKHVERLDTNEREGLGHIRLLIGLRYNIK